MTAQEKEQRAVEGFLQSVDDADRDGLIAPPRLTTEEEIVCQGKRRGY